MSANPVTTPCSDELELSLFRTGADLITTEDRRISAQARAVTDLDRVLDRIVRRDGLQPGTLLDLGCGMGGLARHVGCRLGLTQLVGADLDADRLKGAAARGVRPLLVDLSEDPVPLASDSVRVATCFGLLAYLPLYDNVLSEAGRVLEDGGWLLLSMPNLGSYGNRLALLLGYQPHAVAVSHLRQAGSASRRRDPKASANMPPLLHGATLRCMRELLDGYGFETETVRGFAPGPRRRLLLDDLTSRFPSLSRRFLILARKRAGR